MIHLLPFPVGELCRSSNVLFSNRVELIILKVGETHMSRNKRWVWIVLGAILIVLGMLMLSSVLIPAGNILHDATPLAPTFFLPPGS